MILLYKRDQPILSNLNFIVSATREHSVNLGAFAFLFKSTTCILMNKADLRRPYASAVAGLIAGLIVWGRRKTAINYQIVLYLLSRNITGLINQQVEKGHLPQIDVYPAFASLMWAIVMFIHASSANSLQDGLKSSMDFLYNDDDHWQTRGKREISDFIPFSGR